jgi:hypothetical protein
MRPFDPRSWNLLKPASVLALTACGPGTLEDEGTTVATEDTSDSVGTVTTSSASVTTSYTSYTTYTTYTSYSSYTTYNDYNYDPCNYCEPDELCNGYECYLPDCRTSADCDDGLACIEGLCGTVPESLYCGDWPTLTIDIPAVAGVIDLAFVDVDGDGDEELALLTADGVSVIDDDLSLNETAWVMPGQFTNVVGLRVDDDAMLDLAFTNSAEPGLRTLIGNGDGSFAGEIDDVLEPIVDPIALDLDSDGQDELVGLIAGQPTAVNGVGETAMTSALGAGDTAQHLDHGDNDANGERDLLIAGAVGDPLLLTSNWLLQQNGAWAAGDAQQMLTLGAPSLWAAFDLDGDGLDNAFAVADGTGGSVMQSWSHTIPSLATVPETGLVWIVGAEFDGTNGEEILLGSGSPRLVQRLNANPIGCSYPLVGFPSGGTRAVAGDFDGDAIDEVAVLVGGTVELRVSDF